MAHLQRLMTFQYSCDGQRSTPQLHISTPNVLNPCLQPLLRRSTTRHVTKPCFALSPSCCTQSVNMPPQHTLPHPLTPVTPVQHGELRICAESDQRLYGSAAEAPPDLHWVTAPTLRQASVGGPLQLCMLSLTVGSTAALQAVAPSTCLSAYSGCALAKLPKNAG
jgi:hypothetical protein